MSNTIIAVFIQLLVVILPLFNITIGSAELTNALQTIVTICIGLFIWYKRVQVGDIKIFGARK